MIKTWNHKGLKHFFETGTTSGIQAKHSVRLRLQLAVLNAAVLPTDMDIPGWKFHELKGSKKEYFAVTVNRNWRLTFKF